MSDTVDSLFLVGRRSGEALAMTKSVEVATLVIAHFREEWSRSDIGSQEQHEAMARMAGAGTVLQALAAVTGGASVEQAVANAVKP